MLRNLVKVREVAIPNSRITADMQDGSNRFFNLCLNHTESEIEIEHVGNTSFQQVFAAYARHIGRTVLLKKLEHPLQ